MTRATVKLVREGKYLAEIPVELIEDEAAWSPYLSLDDVRKLEVVRFALREGDLTTAAKYASVFEMTLIAEQTNNS